MYPLKGRRLLAQSSPALLKALSPPNPTPPLARHVESRRPRAHIASFLLHSSCAKSNAHEGRYLGMYLADMCALRFYTELILCGKHVLITSPRTFSQNPQIGHYPIRLEIDAESGSQTLPYSSRCRLVSISLDSWTEDLLSAAAACCRNVQPILATNASRHVSTHL